MNFPTRSLLLFAPLLACCVFSTGCSSGRGEVSFSAVSPTGQRQYLQNFPSAFISGNKSGEFDIVMLKDDLNGKRPRPGNKPLEPIGATPLTQALKIHVFWRPVAGVMLHESSVTNAIIDWYVFGSRDGRHVDLLHYEGAGFVVLHPTGNIASVTINDGQVTPTQSIGDIKDPVGKSIISGTIFAVKNDRRVKEILNELAEQTAAAEHPGSAMPAAAAIP